MIENRDRECWCSKEEESRLFLSLSLNKCEKHVLVIFKFTNRGGGHKYIYILGFLILNVENDVELIMISERD